ncbi:MAG: hypothetical protein PHY95_00475 [Candidatus ainarchaeum sp.]|nr:hypothetical protein [Candidatus ainarchaeum sp.]
MNRPRTIIHGCRHFPEAEFKGRAAVEAANKIRDAIRRGRELDIGERHVPVAGELHKRGCGWALSERPLAGRLTLGAGMIYFRTTTVAFAWNVLGRMLRSGEAGFEFNGTPSYVSDTTGIQGSTLPIVFGRSSLLSALRGLPLERGHHARMRDMLACIGATVRASEMVVAVPAADAAECPWGRGILSVEGEPGLYAVAREVPLEDITIVGSLRFMARPGADAEIGTKDPGEGGRKGKEVKVPRLLEDLCAAEARVEILRSEKGAKEMAAEMMAGIAQIELSSERPGLSW